MDETLGNLVDEVKDLPSGGGQDLAELPGYAPTGTPMHAPGGERGGDDPLWRLGLTVHGAHGDHPDQEEPRELWENQDHEASLPRGQDHLLEKYLVSAALRDDYRVEDRSKNRHLLGEAGNYKFRRDSEDLDRSASFSSDSPGLDGSSSEEELDLGKALLVQQCRDLAAQLEDQEKELEEREKRLEDREKQLEALRDETRVSAAEVCAALEKRNATTEALVSTQEAERVLRLQCEQAHNQIVELKEEKELLLVQLRGQEQLARDMQEQKLAGDNVTSEVQSLFSRQLTMLQEQRDRLQGMLGLQQAKNLTVSELLGQRTLELDSSLQEARSLRAQLAKQEEAALRAGEERQELESRLQESLMEAERAEARGAEVTAALESRAAELETRVRNAENALESARVEHQSRLEAREQEAQEVIAERERGEEESMQEVNALQTELALVKESLSDMDRAHVAAMETLLREGAGKLHSAVEKAGASLRSVHQEEIGRLREGHQEETGRLREKHQEETGRLREEHQKETGRLRKEHQEETGRLRDKHQEETGKIREKHQVETGRIREEYQVETGRLREEYQVETGRLREEYQEETDRLREEYQEQVKGLLEEMKKKQTDLEEEQKSRIALIKQVHERERLREMAELAAEREADLTRLEMELKEAMEAAHQAELQQAQTQHGLELETMRLSLTNQHSTELETMQLSLTNQHAADLESMHLSLTNQHAAELETIRLSLTNQHASELELSRSEQQRLTEVALSELRKSLEAELDRLRYQNQNQDQLRGVQQQHEQEKDDLNQEWEARMLKEKVRMEEQQANQIEALRTEWRREAGRVQEEHLSRLREAQADGRAQQEEQRTSTERELLRLREELSRARAEQDATTGANAGLVASHQGVLQEQQDGARCLEELCTASEEREQRLRQQEDVQRLKEEVQRLKRELSQAEEARRQEEAQQQHLSLAEEEVQRLTRELSQVEEVQRREEAQQLKQELSQTEEEVQLLKQELSQTEGEVQLLKQELSQTEEAAQRLKWELSQAEEGAQRLKWELSQAEEEVQRLTRELSLQRQEIQEQKEAELGDLHSYFERRLRVAEESHQEELALLQRRLAEGAKGGNASFLSEGDVDEDKADMLAEINMKLEKHKEDLYSLRLRLEEKHTAELDQMQASLALSYREQLLQVKTHLADRHSRQTQDLKDKHSLELEQQRAKLTEHHAKEISRLRLQSAQDAARQVERELEERGRALAEEQRALAGQAHSERSRIRSLEEQMAAVRTEQEAQLREAAERDKELTRKAQEKLKQEFVEQLGVAVREARAQEREQALQELSREKEEALGRLREELRAKEELRDSAMREQLKEEEEQRTRRLSPRDSPESDPLVLAVRRKAEMQFERELHTAKHLMAEEVKELNAVLLEQADAKLQETQSRFEKEKKELEAKLGLQQEAAIRELTKKHEEELESQRALLEERLRSLEEELQAKHKAELNSQEAELWARLQGDRDELEARMLVNMDTLESALLVQIQAVRDERDGALQTLRDRERGHTAQMERLRARHQAKLGLICIELRRELDLLLTDKVSITEPQPAQNQPSITEPQPAQNKPFITEPQPAQNQPSPPASQPAQKLGSDQEDPVEEEVLEEQEFVQSGDRVALELGDQFSKLKTDLRTVGEERRALLESHKQLQNVLQEVVRTVASEEEIRQRIHAHGEPRGSCGEEVGEKLPDFTLWSALTDEGVGLSQKPWRSLFSGPGLGRDPQLKKVMLGVSAHLWSAVHRLLDLSQLEPLHPRPQVPLKEHLIQSSPDSAPSQLQESRPPQQLHRAGPVEFGTVEKATLEEVLQQKEAQVQELVEELQELREKHTLLLRQREALSEPLGDTERALLEEAQRLLQEKLEAQRQAEEDQRRLAWRLQLLEAEAEEQDGSGPEAERRRHRAQVEDLRLQVHAQERQLRHHRQFIDEQAVEREQEREEFQQEIQRLEAQLRGSVRTRPGGRGGGSEEEDKIEDLALQVEKLRAAVRQKTEDYELLFLTRENRGDVAEQDEQIHTMAARIGELETALLDTLAPHHAEQLTINMPDRAPLLCSSCLQVFALQRNLDDPPQWPPRSGVDQPLDQQLQALESELRTAGVGQENEHASSAKHLPQARGQKDPASLRLDPRDQLEEQRQEIRQLSEEIFRLRREANASQDQAAEEKEAELEELRLQVEHLRSDGERLRQDREVEEEHLHEVIHKLQEELQRAEIEHHEVSTSPESSPAPYLLHTPRGLEHSLRQELGYNIPILEPHGGEARAGPDGAGAERHGGDAPDRPVPGETLRTSRETREALEAQLQAGRAEIHKLESEKEELRRAMGQLQEEEEWLRQEVTSKTHHIQHLNSMLVGRMPGAGNLREVLTVAEETLAKAEMALRGNEVHLARGRVEHEALKEEHEALKDEHAALKYKHEALKDECEALKEECDARKEEHEDLKDEHEALRDENAALKEEHEALKEECEALEEHGALKDKHEILKDERNAWKWDCKAWEKECEASMDECEALREEHVARKQECEAWKEECMAVKDEYEALEEEHAGLKEEHAALKEEHEALKERDARKEEDEALKKERNARKEEDEAFKEECEARKEEHEALKEECDARKEEHEALKKEYEALKEEDEALKEEYEAFKEEDEALKKKYEALKEEHEALKDECQSLREEHEALKEENLALKEEHEALWVEHEDLKAEHGVLWAEHVSSRLAAEPEELSSSTQRTEMPMWEIQSEDGVLADLDIHSQPSPCQLLGLANQQGEPESQGEGHSLQGDACILHEAPRHGSFLSSPPYAAPRRGYFLSTPQYKALEGQCTPSSSEELAPALCSPTLSQDPYEAPEAFSTPLTLSPTASESRSIWDSPDSEQMKTLDERYFTGLEEWPGDADCSSVSSQRDATLREQCSALEGLSASFVEYLHARDMSVAEATDSATESMGQDYISPELQSLLMQLYMEGHRVFSLSKHPIPFKKTTPHSPHQASPHASQQAPPPSWWAERRALQQTVLSLRELLCKMAVREPEVSTASCGRGLTEEQWLRLEQLLSIDRQVVLEEVQDLRSLMCASSLRSQEQLRLLQTSLCVSHEKGSRCRHGELPQPHLTERLLGRTDGKTKRRAGGEELKAPVWEELESSEMSQEAEHHQQSEERSRPTDHTCSMEQEEEDAQGRCEALGQQEEEVQTLCKLLRQLEGEKVSHACSLEEEVLTQCKLLRQLEDERTSHAHSLEEEAQKRCEALRQLEEERASHALALQEQCREDRRFIQELRAQLEQERGLSEELAATVERLHRQVVCAKRQLEEKEAQEAQGKHEAAPRPEKQRDRADQLQARLDLLIEEAHSGKEEGGTRGRQEEREVTWRQHGTVSHRLDQSTTLLADGCNAETELQLSVDMANQPYNSKVKWLYCRFLRAESHRKALAFQKRYLLLLLSRAPEGEHAIMRGHRVGPMEEERATLPPIADTGACPLPAAPRPQPHTIACFRTVALAAVAISRLSLLVRKWRKAFITDQADTTQAPDHRSRAGSTIRPEVLRRQQLPAVQSSIPSFHTQISRGLGFDPVHQVPLPSVQLVQLQTIRQKSN